MRIILALDIIDGKCVRLTKGDFSSKKVYSDDPLRIAREAMDNGIKFLHLVDLDGARTKKLVNMKVLEDIATATDLTIDFGGGLRSVEDVKKVLNCGAKQVTAGSIAVTNREIFSEWLTGLGPETVILGADCINRKISTGGWMEKSEEDIIGFISGYKRMGVKYAICTDIERDGTLQGPSIELYNDILSEVDIKLIASGGISSVTDIEALKKTGCDGAIIGKAVYEGKISLKELGRLC